MVNIDRKLYKFNADCGRMGTVESIFVADPVRVEALYGREIYFGEILGKHSEVAVDIEESHFTEIDVAEHVLNVLVPQLGETWSGHNPLEYAVCYDCAEDFDSCECET